MEESRHKIKQLGGSHVGRRLACLFLALGLMAAFGGCTRAFYRRQADREVADILDEKDKYPAWKIEQYHVYPDPRARFADPAKPDRPPMPPDDEAAWMLSPHPQHPGHAGVGNGENTAYLEIIKTWDAENRAERTATPGAGEPDGGQAEYLAAAGSPSGPIQTLFDGLEIQQQGFLLKLENAVEMGLINSREYQSFREDLYLAALPVTQQRFSFAWQWAAVTTAIRQWAGPASLVGQQNNWNVGSSVGVSKLFSTGALLTAAFANNTVFNFANAAQGFTSTSTINLDLVQPLLQGGGKAVTLEPLTQAERNLFYAIRSYARFREQFYASIFLGSSLPNSLFRAAGTSSGDSGPISTLAALGIASTDVSGQFRGYLPTLNRWLDWAVDKKYVADLEVALKLFEGFQEGGQVAPLQVDQVRSTWLQAKNTLTKDEQDITNSLDQLKLQLGVPANLPLVLDDAPARPITRQLDRFYQGLADSDAAYQLVEQQDQLAPDKLRPFLYKLFTTGPLVRGMPFQKKLPSSWETWAKKTDIDLKVGLEKLGQERRKLLDLKTDLENGKSLFGAEAGVIVPVAVAVRLPEAEFESDLGGLEQVLRRFEAKPWEKQAKEDLRGKERIKLFRLVAYAGEIVLVWARNDRFKEAGEGWPKLPPATLDNLDLVSAELVEELRQKHMELAQKVAVQAALTNRWDLMNARAQVVDAWRQLAVTANALLGVLNVQYHLDSTTPPGGTRPLAFSSAATNQELIINAQLPLVRLTERNVYRVALINYERARRNLMSLEDGIAAQVRFDVRQLQLFAANYRIQQKVVESLYSQVESSLEVIKAPVDPDQLKASATTGAANAAALTNQYLSALNQLNGAQSRMYGLWLSYLTTRMQLYLDLERLPLDNRGVWIDESGNSADVPPTPVGGPRGHSLPINERRAATAGSAPRARLLAPATAATLEPQAEAPDNRGPGSAVRAPVGNGAVGDGSSLRAPALHRLDLVGQDGEAQGDHRRPRLPGVGEER